MTTMKRRIGRENDASSRRLSPVPDSTAESQPSPAGWDSADLDTEQLSILIAGLAGRINAATCEWLGYVAEADRRGAWSGFASCSAWLSWLCGIGPGTASDHVRVARALVDLPVIRCHFAAGSLSYSQVRALIRGAGIVPEAELVEYARHATGAQLERLIRSLRGVVNEDEEDTAQSRQHATWHIDEDGSLVIKARLSGEWAEAWIAALEQAEAQARRQTGEAVDAVAVMATVAGRALSAPDDAEAPQPTLSVVADLDALTAAVELHEGAGLSAESLSSSSQPVAQWELSGSPMSITTLATLLHRSHVDLIARLSDGTLVDLGRSRRRASARMTRAVLRRHGGRCAHPHCRARAHLHLHHVQHWARGGRTSADNLVPLCGRHHRALHRGDFSIAVDPSASGVAGFRFLTPSGDPIRATAWDSSHETAGESLSHDTQFSRAEVAGRQLSEVNNRGERFSMAYAVGAILAGRH